MDMGAYISNYSCNKLPIYQSMCGTRYCTLNCEYLPWQILTRDSVTVSVDAVVYYRIQNPMMSVVNIEDVSNSTRLLSQTTLRNFLGMCTLTEILTDRDQISHRMQVRVCMLLGTSVHACYWALTCTHATGVIIRYYIMIGVVNYKVLITVVLFFLVVPYKGVRPTISCPAPLLWL